MEDEQVDQRNGARDTWREAEGEGKVERRDLAVLSTVWMGFIEKSEPDLSEVHSGRTRGGGHGLNK